MNCPSRTDDPLDTPGFNQNPPSLAADLTTRQDLNGISNSREQRGNGSHDVGPEPLKDPSLVRQDPDSNVSPSSQKAWDPTFPPPKPGLTDESRTTTSSSLWRGSERRSLLSRFRGGKNDIPPWKRMAHDVFQELRRFGHFIGPGFIIAVAYIDPGNYATDIAAGAQTKYALLFIIFMSNIIAIFLQSLCTKLGSVTGLNLAENCRAHLPKWLNIMLYIFAEAAIIATDIAEVVGTAIALNLLFKIPLVAGCVISLVDVMVILIFYRPNGSMPALRAFEFFVVALVLGVVVCFCIQLSMIQESSVGDIFKGFLPSSAVVKNDGIYLSCGILGATVMPHSLFLGSGIVQSRLRQYDIDSGHIDQSIEFGSSDGDVKYRPSLNAIRGCLKYSVIELAISLFVFATFVNSAILIVAGASLSGTAAGNADLFGIHKLLSQTISPAAGTIFATALLLSGISAGIVCTMAGQMVSEGMLNWTVAPWLRRLITRSISIIPSVAIAAAVGRKGLDTTLTASQVVLSVILPFVSAPLIYFTARSSYMTVHGTGVSMKNHWITTTLAALMWLVVCVMNVALIVLVGIGKA